MADIKKLAPLVLQWEGTQFTDDPDDAGGATKDGVTFNTFKQWFLKNKGRPATLDDLKAIDMDEDADILKEDFWDKCQGDGIRDQQVANMIVDWMYTSGTDAIKKVQALLPGNPVTGNLGNITLGNINKVNPQTLCNAIANSRIAYYTAIISNHPNWAKFKQGWINRANFYRYKPESVAKVEEPVEPVAPVEQEQE